MKQEAITRLRSAHRPITDTSELMGKVMSGSVTLADIHRLPCAECPSMHGHDPETADTMTWPIAEQDKTLFRCAWRSKLCRGYADLIGFTERITEKESPDATV